MDGRAVGDGATHSSRHGCGAFGAMGGGGAIILPAPLREGRGDGEDPLTSQLDVQDPLSSLSDIVGGPPGLPGGAGGKRF